MTLECHVHSSKSKWRSFKRKILLKNSNKTHASLFGTFLILSSLNNIGSCEEEVFKPIIFISMLSFLDTFDFSFSQTNNLQTIYLWHIKVLLYIIASSAHWSRQNPKYTCKMSIKCFKSHSRLQKIVFNLLYFVMLKSKPGTHWAPPVTPTWEENSSFLFQTCS